MSLRPPSSYIAAPGPILIVLALSLMTFQAGCAGSTFRGPPAPLGSAGPASPTLDSVPDWALANTRSDDQSEIGIGSGETLDSATRYALRDVASRLSVSVESQLRDSYREVQGTTAESLEQIIETRVLATRFSGWERTRSIRSGGIFWVEVRINRQRLVRDSLGELNELASNVDMRLESARGSSLARLLALQTTAGDRERISNLVALIDTLDPTFNREFWNARRAQWRLIDESTRRSVSFEIRSDPASREIARWLESELASERLVTSRGNCEDVAAVCIDIRSEIVEANIAHRHIAKIRSFFSVLEPGGNVLREVDLTGRGNSKSDRERARRQALDDLRSNFQASIVLGGLIQP